MYEAARLNASVELLEQCMAAWTAPRPLPADIIINRYFKERRYIGSKDRGAIAALCYLIIRNFATLEWHVKRHNLTSARAFAIAALLLLQKKSLPDVHNFFNGEHFSAARLNAVEATFAKALAGKELLDPTMPDHVRYNYPAWLEKEMQASLGEYWKRGNDRIVAGSAGGFAR